MKEVVYNVTSHPIVIVTKWHEDPLGGPGTREAHVMLKPGDGVELSVVGLALRRPESPFTRPPAEQA